MKNVLNFSEFESPKEFIGLFCLILKANGYTDEKITKMNMPKSRKTVSSYVREASKKLESLGIKHNIERSRIKLVSMGGSKDIENIDANKQANPSGSVHNTKNKSKSNFKLHN
jgi:hypothetical protein